MRRILLYHLFPINHWQEVTEALFVKLPFDRIVVHVSMPLDNSHEQQKIKDYLEKHKVDEILFSANSGKGEVDAMRKFVQTQNLQDFDILTYMHCKGVSKPENKNIFAWTMLMRYFVIEKMDVCEKAFRNGFVTYGINKSIPTKNDPGFRNCRYFYEGNFVSVNLKKIDLVTAVDEHLEYAYYGLEGFWGKLCGYKKGFTAFNSGINHYILSVSPKDYQTSFGRFRYRLVKQFYIFKHLLAGKSNLIGDE